MTIMDKAAQGVMRNDRRGRQFFRKEGLILFRELLDLHCETEDSSINKMLATIPYRAINKTFFYQLRDAKKYFDLDEILESSIRTINPVRIIHMGGLIRIPGSDPAMTFSGEAILAICRGQIQRHQIYWNDPHGHQFSQIISNKKSDATWDKAASEISRASPLLGDIQGDRLQRLYLLGGWSITPSEAYRIGLWVGSVEVLMASLVENKDFCRDQP